VWAIGLQEDELRWDRMILGVVPGEDTQMISRTNDKTLRSQRPLIPTPPTTTPLLRKQNNPYRLHPSANNPASSLLSELKTSHRSSLQPHRPHRPHPRPAPTHLKPKESVQSLLQEARRPSSTYSTLLPSESWRCVILDRKRS